MVLAARGDTAYDIVLILHILCAIVGFGGVMLNGVYAMEARKRRGAEGLAITEANERVSFIAEMFIFAVFPLGILLVLLSGDDIDFDQTWVWLAMVLYLSAITLSLTQLVPRVKKIIGLQKEILAGPPPVGGPPPQAAKIAALGKQVGMIAGVLQILLVAVLTLMVTKPGGPPF
jgi:hypothetical protein